MPQSLLDQLARYAAATGQESPAVILERKAQARVQQAVVGEMKRWFPVVIVTLYLEVFVGVGVALDTTDPGHNRSLWHGVAAATWPLWLPVIIVNVGTQRALRADK